MLTIVILLLSVSYMILCLNRCITKWSKNERCWSCWSAYDMLYRCRTMLTRDVGPLDAFDGLRPNFELTWSFIQSSDNEISMAGKWNTLDNKYLKGKRKHLSTEFLSKCVFVILSNKTVAFYRTASSLKPGFFSSEDG